MATCPLAVRLVGFGACVLFALAQAACVYSSPRDFSIRVAADGIGDAALEARGLPAPAPPSSASRPTRARSAS